MVQYLLNTTAIWLLSLLMYDILLRRESFHNYNRFYLVFTFLLGALFPLVHAEDYSVLYSDTGTVQQVVNVKQNIIAATASKSNNVDLQKWIWLLYLAGVVVSSILLVVELVKLVSMYKSGRKYTEGIFTVVETNKPHAPFSIVNLLFVCSREQYSDEEWQIVTVHEGRHSILYHFFDLMLMQAARIMFWFHPLVYIYNKRLLMVHEYQADKTSRQKAELYGHFLVEQALLSSAPGISHSFNRSPIKNRIVMLTKRSSRAARIKMLVFIPLILACGICFSQNSTHGNATRKGDIISYNGNQIELSKQMPDDTAYVEDPVTKEMQMKVMHLEQHPVKLNGKKLYDGSDKEQRPRFTGGNGKLISYLYKETEDMLRQLPDGKYILDLNRLVADENGKIVYYEYKGLEMQPPAGSTIPEKLKKSIDIRIMQLLDKVKLKPALYDGKGVPANYDEVNAEIWENRLIVKDHQLTYK